MQDAVVENEKSRDARTTTHEDLRTTNKQSSIHNILPSKTRVRITIKDEEISGRRGVLETRHFGQKLEVDSG